jgi:hypothetical protein
MVFVALALLLGLFVLLAVTATAWRGKRRCIEMRSHRGGRRLLIRAYRPRRSWDTPSLSVSLELDRELPDDIEVFDIAGVRGASLRSGLLRLDHDDLRVDPRWLARWRLDGSGLRGRWLTLAMDAPVREAGALTRRVEALADALERAAAGSWPEQAAELGLRWESGAVIGEIEGHRVCIVRVGPDTLVRVPAPRGFRAIGGRGRTGNPIQDMFVKASEALPPDATPALLAVLHGHPGSTVEGGAVRLRIPGHAVDLEPPLRAALDLASALQRALGRARAQ